jgi:hypothetical protein
VEKKWREVGSVFRFSSTTTSASFVLRKHYLNLLYHYEQVHFFKVQGPIFTPSAGSNFFTIFLTFIDKYINVNEIYLYICAILQMHFLEIVPRGDLNWLLFNIHLRW